MIWPSKGRHLKGLSDVTILAPLSVEEMITDLTRPDHYLQQNQGKHLPRQGRAVQGNYNARDHLVNSSSGRITSTGAGECLTTRSVTLPSSQRPYPSYNRRLVVRVTAGPGGLIWSIKVDRYWENIPG